MRGEKGSTFDFVEQGVCEQEHHSEDDGHVEKSFEIGLV